MMLISRSKGWQISPVINEQIKLMSDHILREILSEIKRCMFYGIQADEATDVTYNEQMCFIPLG